MLKKRMRLSAAEVKEVLRRGRSVRVGAYAGKYLPAAGRPLKVAVIVPKKTARKAVARNRLRRVAYHEIEGSAALPRDGWLALFVRP